MKNNKTYGSVVLGYDFSNPEDCYKIFVNNIENGYARVDEGYGKPYEDSGYAGKFFLIRNTSDEELATEQAALANVKERELAAAGASGSEAAEQLAAQGGGGYY